MNTARSGHVGVTLPYNGKVLIAGGTSAGQPVTDNEVYDPITSTFVANEPMSIARDEFAANFFALPAVGQVLMSGGADASGTSAGADRDVPYPTIRTDKATTRRARRLRSREQDGRRASGDDPDPGDRLRRYVLE